MESFNSIILLQPSDNSLGLAQPAKDHVLLRSLHLPHRFSFICSRNNGLKLVMPQRAFYLDRWTSSPISVHHPATSSRHISNATSSRLALVHGPLPHHHTEPRAATRAARFRRLRRASTPGAYFRRPDRGPRPNSEAIRKAVNVSLQQRGRGSSRH